MSKIAYVQNCIHTYDGMQCIQKYKKFDTSINSEFLSEIIYKQT